ncbi:uncharacterized protein SEPMUDRAFT_113755 [Sphaerulina musiva SO2202]|uniref:Uncharacterized protein n=1 Tax=Sphaerulina musiva (strain SO2202) TaxID=692275 RepID=N1QMY7_SPHMS|nr:uncharacterized protein SEPMUDRAFT_113755 [Sphaerulina musiva SO2202]EMF17777.1 hypothetical protein SEPMUDRAFT_113755 [Sphaerulina musiva SO2202]
MYLLHFIAIALLAVLAIATPISSADPQGQFDDASLLGMTPTSTGLAATALRDLPTSGPCKAFYFDPKDNVPCGSVARQFMIYLSYPEYDQTSTSEWCEVFLQSNGICRATSPNSPSAFPTPRASTLSISTLIPTQTSVATISDMASTTRMNATATCSSVIATVSVNGATASPVSPGSNSTMSTSTAAPSSTNINTTAATGPITSTTSRYSVVLASERESLYSASVLGLGITPNASTLSESVTTSTGLSTESNGPSASSPASSSAVANSTNPIVRITTRVVSFTIDGGNRTSLMTALVNAYVVANATTTAIPIRSSAVTSATE